MPWCGTAGHLDGSIRRLCVYLQRVIINDRCSRRGNLPGRAVVGHAVPVLFGGVGVVPVPVPELLGTVTAASGYLLPIDFGLQRAASASAWGWSNSSIRQTCRR